MEDLLGISERVHAMHGRMSEEDYNLLSLRLDLQPDLPAGVWAHLAQAGMQMLEPGDIEEALQAGNAVGDDGLQRETQGCATRDSFTHGTQTQRLR